MMVVVVVVLRSGCIQVLFWHTPCFWDTYMTIVLTCIAIRI